MSLVTAESQSQFSVLITFESFTIVSSTAVSIVLLTASTTKFSSVTTGASKLIFGLAALLQTKTSTF